MNQRNQELGKFFDLRDFPGLSSCIVADTKISRLILVESSSGFLIFTCFSTNAVTEQLRIYFGFFKSFFSATSKTAEFSSSRSKFDSENTLEVYHCIFSCLIKVTDKVGRERFEVGALRD